MTISPRAVPAGILHGFGLRRGPAKAVLGCSLIGAFMGLTSGQDGETAILIKVLLSGSAGGLVGFLKYLLEREIMQFISPWKEPV